MRERLVSVSVRSARLNIEYKYVKASLGAHGGIELTKRASRCVSRVCHKRLSLSFSLLVYLIKHTARHIYFPSHHYINRVCELHRDASDSSEVCRDVLSDKTVTASSTAYESAALIGKRHRQSVYLRLNRIRRMLYRTLNLVAEGLELIVIKHV